MSLANPALSVVDQNRRSIWVTVGYFLSVLTPVIVYIILGNVQYLKVTEHNGWLTTVTFVQLAFIGFPIVSSLIALAGMLVFGAPRDLRPDRDWRWNPDFRLIVAYVSRGNQPEVLHRATSQSQAVLDQLAVYYEIEVVTDVEIAPENHLRQTGGEIIYHVVPKDYQTSRGARYKARALQYLLEQRNTRLQARDDSENIWVLHMDEESVLTPEAILGIQDHIAKYDLRTTDGAIGQGEILYNSLNYGDNLWTSSIDAARTGGDLGQFRMQYKALHKPLVGMHGSYVLTPAKIERETTWDVGGHGSITEDSYFALLAMERGVKFDWVEGFIREQSPFTVFDIVRQRRRWYCGLSHVSRDPALKLWTRFTLRVFVWFWTLSAILLPLPLVYVQQRFMFGSGILPYEIFMTAAACTGFYAAAYSLGAYRNILHCDIPFHKKIAVFISALVAWFFYIPAMVECAGTLYGLFFPVSSFYVVAKDARRIEGVPTSA